MADINFSRPRPELRSAAEPELSDLRWDFIELLFFAYRDFVGDADHELEAFGFGRAHHRVMHFVYRYPGLKVADLLDVLRITKQSLGRVLKQAREQQIAAGLELVPEASQVGLPGRLRHDVECRGLEEAADIH